MALSMAHDLSLPLPAQSRTAQMRQNRPRRITPQAGRALEVLGHAIEYLTDEFVHRGSEMSAHNAQVEAVQLLMGINRAIYFECPRIPSLGERIRSLFHLRAA